MPDMPKAARARVSAIKLGAIAVLAIILLIVLVVQFMGGQTAPGASSNATQPASSRALLRNPAAGMPSARAAERDVAGWPVLDREEAAACDPFVLPAALAWRMGVPTDPSAMGAGLDPKQHAERKHRAGERQKLLELLRTQGVSAILRNADGPAAAIGPRIVRVGDLVDGFRVVEIRPDGVILESADGE